MKKHVPARITEFIPPSRMQMGDNLARETARLSEVASAEKDADRAEIDEQKRLLQPEIKTAREQLALLGEFLKDNDSDLRLLRSVDAKAVNGRYHDPTGLFGVAVKNAIARVEELFSGISQARDNLNAVETRVNRLTSESIAARVFMRDDRFASVFPRDGWYPREPAQIRVSVVRETRRIANLPRALDAARGAVAQLIDKINQMERLAGREGPKKSEASTIPPDELARRAVARPVREGLRAVSDFTPYSDESGQYKK